MADRDGTLDMDLIARIVERAYGIPCYVEQTGGGVATIYAGTPSATRNAQASEDWERYPVIAGPGYFAGPGWSNARGHVDDFAIGPDDDGVEEYVLAESGWDELDCAEVIASQVMSAE